MDDQPPLVTHHSVGECVAGLRHRQTLDDLWGHPGKRAHQRHVRRVGQEPGRSEITDLKTRGHLGYFLAKLTNIDQLIIYKVKKNAVTDEHDCGFLT